MNPDSNHAIWTRTAQAAVIAVAVAFAVHPIWVDDLWMSLAHGRWIAEHGRIPVMDPFSWTTVNQRWVDFEWMFQLLVYSVYRVVGLNGLIIFFGLIAAATTVLLGAVCRRILPPGLVWPTTLAAIVVMSGRWLSYRADFVSLALTAMVWLILEQARGGKPNRLWLLPVLMWIWAQTHGAFMVELFLIGAYVAGSVLQPRFGKRTALSVLARNAEEWKRVGWVVTFVVGSIFLNPFGWNLPLHILEVMRPNISGAFILEWQPITALSWSADWTLSRFFYVAGFAGGVVGFVLRRRTLDWTLFLVWLGFVMLSWRSLRFDAYFALVGIPIAVAQIAAWWRDRNGCSFDKPVIAFSAVTVSIALMVSLVLGGRWWIHHSHLPVGLGIDPLINPAAAVGHLQKQPRTQRLFNDGNLGNYLMWTMPERTIFFDPRNFLYGDWRMLEYITALEDRDAWERAQQRRNFDAVILQNWNPKNGSLIRALARDSRWTLLYFDLAACVFVRREEAQGWTRGGLTDFNDETKVAQFRARLSENFLPQSLRRHFLPAQRLKREKELRLMFARALYHAAADEAAEREFQSLLREDPNLGDAVIGLALIAADRRDWANALERTETGLRLDPSNTNAHLLRAYIHSQQGQPRKALAGLENVTRLDPSHTQAWLDQSALWEQLNDLPRATEATRRAIDSQSPPNPLQYTRLAALLDRQGKLDEAITAAKRALALWPNNPGLPASDSHKIRQYIESLERRLRDK